MFADIHSDVKIFTVITWISILYSSTWNKYFYFCKLFEHGIPRTLLAIWSPHLKNTIVWIILLDRTALFCLFFFCFVFLTKLIWILNYRCKGGHFVLNICSLLYFVLLEHLKYLVFIACHNIYSKTNKKM